jgi:hypothetical protein
MAGKLTARKVETTKPGKYSDGGNLYLIVSETGSRKWVLRFTWPADRKRWGLAAPPAFPLLTPARRPPARRKIALGLTPSTSENAPGALPRLGKWRTM